MTAFAWPSPSFEEEMAVVEAQLDNARAWHDELTKEIEAYNELITRLESNVFALRRRVHGDNDR